MRCDYWDMHDYGDVRRRCGDMRRRCAAMRHHCEDMHHRCGDTRCRCGQPSLVDMRRWTCGDVCPRVSIICFYVSCDGYAVYIHELCFVLGTEGLHTTTTVFVCASIFSG